jgi:hypothetical protein
MTECNLLWDGGIGAWLRNAALRLQLRASKKQLKSSRRMYVLAMILKPKEPKE